MLKATKFVIALLLFKNTINQAYDDSAINQVIDTIGLSILTIKDVLNTDIGVVDAPDSIKNFKNSLKDLKDAVKEDKKSQREEAKEAKKSLKEDLKDEFITKEQYKQAKKALDILQKAEDKASKISAGKMLNHTMAYIFDLFKEINKG